MEMASFANFAKLFFLELKYHLTILFSFVEFKLSGDEIKNGKFRNTCYETKFFVFFILFVTFFNVYYFLFLEGRPGYVGLGKLLFFICYLF